MPFPLVPILMGGASLLGGLINKPNRTTTSTTGGTSTTTPTIAPQYKSLNDLVLSRIQGRLAGGGLPGGYESLGLGNINHASNIAQMAARNRLAGAGLASSPVAGVVQGNAELNRGSQIAQFQNSLPLLQRQLQTEDLGLAGNLLNLGRGSTTTSTGTSTGSETQPGSWGSGFENIAQMLGFLYGQGAFGKKPATVTGAATTRGI